MAKQKKCTNCNCVISNGFCQYCGESYPDFSEPVKIFDCEILDKISYLCQPYYIDFIGLNIVKLKPLNAKLKDIVITDKNYVL